MRVRIIHNFSKVSMFKIRNKRSSRPATNIGPNYPHPIKVSLNMLRFHRMLRVTESFHTFLPISPVNPTTCY